MRRKKGSTSEVLKLKQKTSQEENKEKTREHSWQGSVYQL